MRNKLALDLISVSNVLKASLLTLSSYDNTL